MKNQHPRSSVPKLIAVLLVTVAAGVAAQPTFAHQDTVTISVSGIFPPGCTVTITYHDGDKHKSYSCNVEGNGASDASFSCPLPDDSIRHLNDGSSYVEVGITDATASSCAGSGGFTLDKVKGNGSGSTNFEIDDWKKGNSSEGNQCIDGFFGKKINDPVYGTYWDVARFAGDNGKVVDGQILQSFVMNVSKDTQPQDEIKKVKSCETFPGT